MLIIGAAVQRLVGGGSPLQNSAYALHFGEDCCYRRSGDGRCVKLL